MNSITIEKENLILMRKYTIRNVQGVSFLRLIFYNNTTYINCKKSDDLIALRLSVL